MTEKLKINIVQLYDNDQGSNCGYCKDSETGEKNKTSFSFGFVTKNYPADIYEKMMFNGWRRCGDYTYKPNLFKSCCKQYTCRLNIDNYKINKDQKKVMKKFRKFLKGEIDENNEKNKKNEKNNENNNKINNKNNEKNEKNKNKNIDDKYKNEIEKFIDEYLNKKLYLNVFNNFVDDKNIFNKLTLIRNLNRKFGDYSSNIIIILLNYIKKLNQIENNLFENLSTKFFDSIFQFYEQNNLFKQNYKITLSEKTFHLNFIVNNVSEYNEFIKEIENQKKENQKNNNNNNKNNNNNNKKNKKNKNKNNNDNNQNNINNNQNNNNNNNINNINNNNQPEEQYYSLEYFPELIPEPKITYPLKHTYTCELSDTITAIPDRFEVYKKYQIAIHKDPPNKLSPSHYNDSWGESNLTSNNLIPYPPNFFTKTKFPNLFPKKYGTYNFIHKIDGKIIAIGVWDILPTSLSSVYLFYDPDYSFLNLGVFTAVREIEYMKNFQNLVDKKFKFYVLGFYIDNCQKMKYKGNYHPLEILCPISNKFVFLDNVKNVIKDNNVHQLSNEKNENNFNEEEINKIIDNLNIEFKGKKINFIQFMFMYINKNYIEKIIKTVKNFIGLIGKDVFNDVEFCAEFNY